MKKVLILDANQRSALAVTRSLGKRGVIVVTADETTSSLAGSSRFSRENQCYPSPVTSPDEFIATISELIKSEKIDLILPMTELTSNLLLHNQDILPNNVQLPFPDLATIDSLSNKCALMKLAQSLAVPIPQTWFAENPDNLPVMLESLDYPIVLKPGKSWIQVEHTWLHTSVQLAKNPQHAKEILATDPAFSAHPFMLQECVPGHGQGIFAIYNNGKPIAFFSHQRLREKPPWGGVSVLSESTEIDPLLLKHAKSLLDAAHWHGVAMVEFKVDGDTPYLMEINTRFWGSLQLAIDAGVDFPWLLHQIAFSQPIEPVKDYKTGIRLRWLLGDLDHLYLVLKDKKTGLGNKLCAIARFLTPNLCTKHEVNRWGDLKPFAWEIKQYLRDLLK